MNTPLPLTYCMVPKSPPKAPFFLAFLLLTVACTTSQPSIQPSAVPTPSYPELSDVQVTTLAGQSEQGFSEGKGNTAQFAYPWGIAVTHEGNIYVSDRFNHRIRKILSDGTVTTVVGSREPTFSDGLGTEARFNNPQGITPDANGNIYVADTGNHRIRKIFPDGMVSTIAGKGAIKADGSGGLENGSALMAAFNSPSDLVRDTDGQIYVVDTNNHSIRKISSDGQVSTWAGNQKPGFADGPGNNARFFSPRGIAIDGGRNLYISDSLNHRIRKISPDGQVSTFVGSGEAGFADNMGLQARFNEPTGIVFDGWGNLYVSDNHRIRKVSREGMVSTLAGNGVPEFEDGNALQANFNTPMGLAIDPQGRLYVADSSNHRIRVIAPR